MSAQPEPTEKLPDAEVIADQGTPLVINGIKARLRPLKTRAFVALMGIFTNGLGPAIRDVKLDFKGGAEAVGPQLVALAVMVLPSAVDDFVYFLGEVVDAVDEDDRTALKLYLHDDPDPFELIEIFEAVATQEQDNLVQLMGKAQASWSRVAPLYSKSKTPKRTGSARSGSGARSPKPST